MSDKSFVTMEQQVCLVCGQLFDTGSLLVDLHLRKRFDRNTATGWGLCPEHKAKHQEGYIALVECDKAKSTKISNDNISPEGAWRTGTIVHLRREVAKDLFRISDAAIAGPMVFYEPELIKILTVIEEANKDKS